MSLKRTLINYLCKLYYHYLYIRYPITKKVLFNSFFGGQYSDNPRAISEKLHEMYPDYEIVWILPDEDRKDGFIPPYVRIVVKNTKGHQEMKEIATSFCYVYNCELTNNICKRRKQLFIQTWHGSIALKKVLHDAETPTKPREPVMDDKFTDFCLAGSNPGFNSYRTAFRYTGEILCVGTPRNDKLLHCDSRETLAIKRRIGINSDVKVLIYAPTFRDHIKRDHIKTKQNVNVDLQQCISILEKKGCNWVCLIRAHIASSGLDFIVDGNKFMDVSTYPDMADLLSIGDLLITDYSSCAGDFILRNKGVILAAFDKDDYENNDRELAFNLEEAGYIIAYNQSQLDSILEEKTEDDYANNCRNLYNYFRICESGRVSKIVCDRIHEFYKSNFKY